MTGRKSTAPGGAIQKKEKSRENVLGRYKHWTILFSICLLALIAWSLLSLFWLSLREPRAVKKAIAVLEERGFVVKGKNAAVNPLFYELGWSFPDRHCFNFDRRAIQIEPIEELKKAFNVVNPTYVIWRSDPSLGDRELTVVQDVSRLKSLDIAHTSVTDASFSMLMKKPALEYVDADNTLMTKEVLWEIGKYRNRDQRMYLCLRHCKLSDEDIQRLMNEFYGSSMWDFAFGHE